MAKHLKRIAVLWLKSDNDHYVKPVLAPSYSVPLCSPFVLCLDPRHRVERQGGYNYPCMPTRTEFVNILPNVYITEVYITHPVYYRPKIIFRKVLYSYQDTPRFLPNPHGKII